MNKMLFYVNLNQNMIDLSPKRISAYGIILFVYVTVWADIILGIPEPSAFSTAWFILSFLKNSIRIGFMLYVSSQLSIFANNEWKNLLLHLPTKQEITRAFLVTFFSLGCAGIGALAAWFGKLSNPVFEFLPQKPILSLLPFLLLSSISVGYGEELFFRFLLIDALTEVGTAPNTAAIVSMIIFALSHYAQGIFGIAFAGVLAALYTSLRFRGYGIHSLALGHALYDAAILVFALS